MGLFEHPYVDEKKAEVVLNDPSHRDLARVAAQRSAVLLQNTGSVLPLSPNYRSIAVIGPLADAQRDTLGSWVFNQQDTETVTVLKGIERRAGDKITVSYAEGVRLERNFTKSPFAAFGAPRRAPVDATAEFSKAVAVAKDADVVVMVLGENQDMTGESASRAALDLPGRQLDLLKAVAATGRPVVLVLMAGRPLDLTEAQKLAPGILMAWYPGTQGGNAVADLLFGDINPSGKLPVTWPRNASQLPVYYNHLNTMSPLLAGRRYWDQPSSPLYPFGYGISYTTFDYAKPVLDRPVIAVGETITVSTTLKNTGTVRGDEVAQLYIHQQYGSTARPVKELKGFQRVTLDPGEARTVTFHLGPKELTYWSPVSRSWVLEPSKFDVWIGSNSDTSNRATFDTTGPGQVVQP
jgi:beta-glucosidase